MPEDPRRFRADRTGGFDEQLFLDRQRFCLNQSHVTGPPDDGERQHAIGNAGAKRRNDRECQSQAGNGKEQFGEAHDDSTNPATTITGDDAERDADDRRDAGDDDTDPQRRPRADDDARKDIRAHFIRAEPVGAARRLQLG
ncbi:hypothetical protein D3C73_1055220 [compost metagenome]